MPGIEPIKGRGVAVNLPNRFEAARYVEDPDVLGEAGGDDPRSLPLTQFLADQSRSILSRNTSPDIPFDVSLNPYRGCEHGCCYCYARPTHEYLGLSAGLDFERKILVKHDAPELLRGELMRPKWTPQPIALCGVTDCYQPIERKLQITRRCLQVLAEFRNPVTIITKNALVLRDLDILTEMSHWHGVRVTLSITTLDPQLTRIMEPRTSVPARRLEAIRQLSAAGIPVGVMVAPIVPAINDHQILEVLAAARAAGAGTAGFQILRLPFGVKDLFVQWLEQHFPDRKDKVIHRIESLRGGPGKLNCSAFGQRLRGEGIFAQQITEMFQLGCRRVGLNQTTSPSLSTAQFRRPMERGDQLELFGD